MSTAGPSPIRRAGIAAGLAVALLSTGGVAIAQQVPPPGVVPAPPPVPPVTLPPEVGPVGEAVSAPGTFACSIPGGIVSIARFAAVAAGLTRIDVDAASPWLAPLYSACLAFPPPVEPTQCDVDRELRANGYGPNGLPITIFFPDPVGMLVTPLVVAEREAAARAGALPAEPGGTVASQLGCEKLQPVRGSTSDQVPAPPPAPDLPIGSSPAAAAGTSELAVGVPDTTSGVGGSGRAAGLTAGAPTAATAPAASTGGDSVAGASPLATARTASASTGNRYLQNLLTIVAGIVLAILVWGTAMARRPVPPDR